MPQTSQASTTGSAAPGTDLRKHEVPLNAGSVALSSDQEADGGVARRERRYPMPISMISWATAGGNMR